eukprot:2873292-Rhodomonas_salina.2
MKPRRQIAGGTFVARTARTAYPMHVVFVVRGRIVVDNLGPYTSLPSQACSYAGLLTLERSTARTRVRNATLAAKQCTYERNPSCHQQQNK